MNKERLLELSGLEAQCESVEAGSKLNELEDAVNMIDAIERALMKYGFEVTINGSQIELEHQKFGKSELQISS